MVPPSQSRHTSRGAVNRRLRRAPGHHDQRPSLWLLGHAAKGYLGHDMIHGVGGPRLGSPQADVPMFVVEPRQDVTVGLTKRQEHHRAPCNVGRRVVVRQGKRAGARPGGGRGEVASSFCERGPRTVA